MSSHKFPIQQEEVISIKPQGLWTYPNPLSAVPQGALKIATNVIMDRPNVIEQRRGINAIGTALSDSIHSFYNYQNKVIIHHGTSLGRDSDGAFTWVDYSGTYAPPTGALKIRSFQSNKNIYFTTSTGIKKLDAVAGTVASAGAPAGLDGSGSSTGSGWFTNNTQVAYRVVFGYTDANNNLVLGAPSQRIIVSNSSGGATNASLTFTLPDGLTTAWQYQVYRSPMSANLSTEPNDECALVYTGNPSGAEITAKVVTITDSVDDSLKGAMIYTASSQQGLAQSNYPPPICTDVATFKGFTFYGNITSQQQLFLTLVSVGSPSGIQADDTITIGGVTYTGKAGETIASAQFKVSTGGTPSQNITDTANSLIRVINRYASSTVYAYYQSGYADLPGKILITERGIGGASFTAASTRGGAFVPNIGTAHSSSNNTQPNGIRISKYLQPEAVPLGQTVYPGSADKSILRIIALRDYVLIFKQDGVYQITGSDINSFQVEEVDKTTVLRGIETAVPLNNKVFMFSNQTIVSLTFNEGAILKAQPIKADLLKLSSPLYPNFDTASYGVAYESDNKYIFGTVTNTTDTVATQYFVYNYLTDTWTNWTFPFNMGCGFVNPTDDKLYFGSVDSSSRYVYQERKNFSSTDYADNSYAATIVSSSGTSVVVTDTSTAQVGYTLDQADRIAVITAVVDSTHLLVSAVRSWTAAAATYYKPIPISLRFVPEACGNAGTVKHFKEAHAIFSVADFLTFNLGFATDFYTTTSSVPLMPKVTESWDTGPWGSFLWGGGVADLQVIRGVVPLSQRRGHWLNMAVDYSGALTNFALDGFAIYYQGMSQRFK